VDAGGQLPEEPFGAFLGVHVLGLGVQKGVVDGDAVTLVQLNHHRPHVGKAAGLLVQQVRFQLPDRGD
jgi:hypothetical protein